MSLLQNNTMLHKSWISNIQIYTDEWKTFRLGKFTSSKAVDLMAEKDVSVGFLSYVDQKVGEYISGQNIAYEDDEIEDENTVWGLQYEPEALNKFGLKMGIKYLVTQKIIHQPGTLFSSTPDALHIINSSLIKEDCYNVASVEVKCPRKYPRFLALYRCNTPADLKKVSKKYYFQVIDQMYNCCASIGYFACYHPLFPEGKNLKIITFSKLELWDDFSRLAERKILAEKKFKEALSAFT